jgi:hypothetical protein
LKPIDVLKLARSRGLTLWAGPGGQLCWRCEGPLPDDLRALLTEHKSALLELLPPAWDQDEADRLLAEARSASEYAETKYKAGRMTDVQRNVVQIWLEVAEGYARDHEMEARRGWHVMPLLREAVREAVGKATAGQSVTAPRVSTASTNLGRFAEELLAAQPPARP